MSDDRALKRRGYAAAELLIEHIELSQADADKLVNDARAWFEARYGIDDFLPGSVELAMRAAYMYGMSKRLEN